MKIGTLTFHYAHNYGALLQAYALREFLREKGYQANILDYRNKSIDSEYVGKLKYRYGIKDLRHIRLIPRWISTRRNIDAAQHYWKKRYNSFNGFIQQYILEGNNRQLEISDLEALDYDAFIAGSDQIWNQYLERGIDPVYFLDFKTNAIKIFYAASNGYDHIPKESMEYYQRVLNKSVYVSTREKSLAEQINTHCDTKAQFVVDPSFLLSAEEYDKIAAPSIPDDKYVMAYFIYEDKHTQQIAEYIARVLNIKLVEFRNLYRRDLDGHYQYTDKSPNEFLTYIKNAEFIVTNSFHGTAFSVIYKKRFYSVYEKDARKGDLLSSLGLDNRHIFDASDVDLNEDIDYITVYKKLSKIRKEADGFLSKALQKGSLI